MSSDNQTPATPAVTPTQTVDPKTQEQGQNNGAANNNANDGGKTPEVKTFTQDQIDNIVSTRVNDVKDKLTKEFQSTLEKTLEEERKNAKLSAEEREKVQREKEDAQRQERERNITLRENRAAAKETFAELGLNQNLVDFVVDLDPEKMKEKITALKASFDKAVEEAVASKLAGNPPKDPNVNNPSNNQQPNNGQKPYSPAF